jgi:hypothetical protein
MLRPGGGRGAYEITGLKATGHQLRDVLDKSLVVSFPPHLSIRTQLRVVASGGKARFITEHEYLKRFPAGAGPALQGNEVRINRQLAAALLMPSPTGYNEHPPAAPLPSTDAYMITSISGVLASVNADQFTIVPTEVRLRNGSGEKGIDPQRRFGEVKAAWARRAVFPQAVSELLEEHEAAVRSEEPISDEACELVGRLQTAIAEDPSDAWGRFNEAMDPLPAIDRFSPPGDSAAERYEATHAPTVVEFPPENAAPEYAPDDSDQRTRVFRDIADRRGQTGFRNALRRRYGDICLVSGCGVIDAIEAAHIVPYRGVKDNNPENGLLLRADFHTLFDLDLVGIDPGSLTVRLHAKLRDHYGQYEGRRLLCPDPKRPSRSALEARYKCFQQRMKED